MVHFKHFLFVVWLEAWPLCQNVEMTGLVARLYCSSNEI